MPRMASACGRTLKLEQDEYIQGYIRYASGNLINVWVYIWLKVCLVIP